MCISNSQDDDSTTMCLSYSPDDDPQDEDFGRVQEDRTHRSESSTSYCVFGEAYAPQTKILEGRTNLSERVFEALFKGEVHCIWETNR
jgi:hypothetical protein